MARFESVSQKARQALAERGIEVRHGVHLPNRHSVANSVDGSYYEYDDVDFPEGTEEGDNGFQHDDVPEDYDPYYRMGPTVMYSERFFRLADGTVFAAELWGELDVWEGELPSYTSDGHYKTWRKASSFAKWEITGQSPYAQSFLADWERNPDLRRQPYAINMYNHIMQPDPRAHIEMVLHSPA